MAVSTLSRSLQVEITIQASAGDRALIAFKRFIPSSSGRPKSIRTRLIELVSVLSRVIAPSALEASDGLILTLHVLSASQIALWKNTSSSTTSASTESKGGLGELVLFIVVQGLKG
jgi:hypothetical protein